MRVPVVKSLPIVGTEIAVKVLPKAEIEGNLGRYFGEDLEAATPARIDLSGAVHPSCVHRVLVHEALHGILDRTGLSYYLETALGAEQGLALEEAIVTAFDIHLPPVLERLQQGEEKDPPLPKRQRAKS